MTSATPSMPPGATALGERSPDSLAGISPCLAPLRPAYEASIARGRARMSGQRVLICGLARDVAPGLAGTLARIETLAAAFREHRVILVENDSHDGTAERLCAWARSRDDVEVLSQRLGAERWPQATSAGRAAAMASHRNRYLSRAVAAAADFDHLIVLDTDLVDFSQDGVAHSFGQDRWDVMGSYGIQHVRSADGSLAPWFFDTWAFREHGEPARHRHRVLKHRRFVRGGPRVPVVSCFGGLAIYRVEAIRSGASYDGPDCEQVIFHRRLAAAGFDRIYMNPSQMTLYPERAKPAAR